MAPSNPSQFPERMVPRKQEIRDNLAGINEANFLVDVYKADGTLIVGGVPVDAINKSWLGKFGMTIAHVLKTGDFRGEPDIYQGWGILASARRDRTLFSPDTASSAPARSPGCAGAWNVGGGDASSHGNR